MIDVEKCCDCEFAYHGGFWECGDGYIFCMKLGEIVYYEYGPIYTEKECPMIKEFDD